MRRGFETTREFAVNWMREHRDVIVWFEKFARQMAEKNRRFGMGLLRERVRWEVYYTYGLDEFKFPNEVSPYIGRYLLWKYPELRTLMRCRLTDDETDEIIYVTDAELKGAVYGTVH